ncbi:ribonuclease YeeF family protein [Metabacillus halosaccharovorans]|uniref:ribonuclease YeeF family protein n=1 Tax=Metabacillus halosaccharovorans TaxID=930124 RepID=UPI001C1F3B6E|nr:T7SS effector LXG polymorphic toxin [Metabacillus halosaccharovorans]MBU7591734.1 hypothetical protein [Metabacillus halosaccharovorans]
MANVKVLESRTLIESMEDRSTVYKDLREKLDKLKMEFTDIVQLDDNLTGKGADAIKGFYQAQVDVVEALLRFVDMQIAFFNGVSGSIDESNLSGDTIVDVNFLETDLSIQATNHIAMVDSQQEDLKKIFRGIDDIISLDAFSTDQFDTAMSDAKKKREDTVKAVDSLDQQLKEEYMISESAEYHIAALFQQLLEATAQGNTIQPINFDSQAYKASEAYQLTDEVEQYANEYLTFKEEQEKFREELKKAEELENRPWYEKAWDGVKTFTGEITGYYDYLRASEGVDPVTGEKLTAGQRVAAGAMATAGFIPVVGWAGRIFKGGNAIYKTAKGMNAADRALDVYRTSKTFSNLEMAEMGIYGLVSANGFSEYLTGKDMFGNELTVEQQQNSLYQALGLLGIAGTARYIDHLQTSKLTKGGNKSTNNQNGTFSSENLNSLKGFDTQLDEVLENIQMTRAEFNDLKLKSSSSLTLTEIEKMKAIRNAVTPITKETLIQKTIPVQDIQKYLDGDYIEIGGYVAKAEDVYDIKAYDEFIESLRLDYKDWEGNRPFPDDGNSYGIIRFKTEATDKIDIPFGRRFGGENEDGPPCTLNGFTGSRNGRTVPEFKFNGRFLPVDGAELYKVVNGEEKIVGIFDERIGNFIPVK